MATEVPPVRWTSPSWGECVITFSPVSSTTHGEKITESSNQRNTGTGGSLSKELIRDALVNAPNLTPEQWRALVGLIPRVSLVEWKSPAYGNCLIACDRSLYAMHTGEHSRISSFEPPPKELVKDALKNATLDEDQEKALSGMLNEE